MSARPEDDPLLAGFRRYRAREDPAARGRRVTQAKRGQRPHTAVVTCSDARLDPQALFDAGPGELFVIRNMGGLVPTYAPDGGCHGTSAALEYAVKILRVRRIVILGHADCDAVHAMLHGPLREARDFVLPWMDIAEPVLWPIPDPAPDETLETAVERAVVRLSLDNLRTFPWIAAREADGRLILTSLSFDLATGDLVSV